MQTVDVDKDAQFHCVVSGHPVYEINWIHDGKPIIRDNRIEVSATLCYPLLDIRSDISVAMPIYLYSLSVYSDSYRPASVGYQENTKRRSWNVSVFRDQ